MSSATRSVQFGLTQIPFATRQSQRRESIAITVEPSSRVRVVTPSSCPVDAADAAVRRKAAWILEQWDEQRRRASSMPREFVRGETYYYLGRGYKLLIRPGEKSAVRLTGGRFEVALDPVARESETSAHIQAKLEDWYRVRGMAYLSPLVLEYSGKIGVVAPPVSITAFKTRWGSCSPRGIRFDWRIMMAPRQLVRYVVAHEVCHLRHADHSRSFWRLLERVMPDYSRRHAELSTLGPRLSF